MRVFLAVSAVLASLAITTDAAPLEQAPFLLEAPTYTKAADLSADLQARLDINNLKAHLEQFQKFANANGKTRVFGSVGHNATLSYIEDIATRYGYDVSSQYLTFERTETIASEATIVSPSVADPDIPIKLMTYTGSTSAEGVTAELFHVPNFGCSAEDFVGAEGKIVLVSRGTCAFGDKSFLAYNAKAVGAIIYNNIPDENLSGTLGTEHSEHVPTGGVSQQVGNRLAGLTNPTIKLTIIEKREESGTRNICAQTKTGNKQNVVVIGAHSDSVPAGPGINDNGSGSAALIELLTLFHGIRPVNAVRFCWWTSEEYGLLGSKGYVESLTEAQRAEIALYLNFDMIASPNYYNGIYDGDGSDSPKAGPPGSAEIEKLFQDYFTSIGEYHEASAFDGRSDYGPFIEVGIPAGGLFTGAEEKKTADQVAKYGGQADVAFDACYHEACDDINNINNHAFLTHSKAIAHAIATYSTSTASINSQKGTQTAVRTKSATAATTASNDWIPGTLHGVVAI